MPLTAPETVGLILAGGRSTRFGGQDKALVQLAGEPLLGHVIRRLAPQVDRLAVSSNAPAESYRAYGLPVIPDRLSGHLGPLAGIHAGLSAWPEANVVSVAVDLPFLPGDLVDRLSHSWDGSHCRFADDGRRHALAILWPSRWAARVEAFLKQGRHSLRDWLVEHGEPVIFAADSAAWLRYNINSPGDLQLAERHLAGSA